MNQNKNIFSSNIFFILATSGQEETILHSGIVCITRFSGKNFFDMSIWGNDNTSTFILMTMLRVGDNPSCEKPEP